MKLANLIFALIFLTMFSCKTEENNKQHKIDLGKETSIDKVSLKADKNAIILADSITYITNVINPNPEEAYYKDSIWLKGTKVQVFANLIFKNVYEGKLKAYDYMTGKEMSISEIKELEKEYKRSDIGQILFTENWYYNESEIKMYKQVNSVMLAYYRYDENGYVIGNYPGIRVYFNNTKPMKGALDY